MATYQLDITKEHCPMTFVKTKVGLSRLSGGDILEVSLLKGEPLENVPKSAEEQGHEILKIVQVEGDIYQVIIRKR